MPRPYWRALQNFKFAWLPPTVDSNCSEAVCLAARTLRSTFRIVMIFVKYREVSTRTLLPNFIGNCKDSIVFTFWQRHRQKREKEEAYVEEVYVRHYIDNIIQKDRPALVVPSTPSSRSL